MEDRLLRCRINSIRFLGNGESVDDPFWLSNALCQRTRKKVLDAGGRRFATHYRPLHIRDFGWLNLKAWNHFYYANSLIWQSLCLPQFRTSQCKRLALYFTTTRIHEIIFYLYLGLLPPNITPQSNITGGEIMVHGTQQDHTSSVGLLSDWDPISLMTDPSGDQPPAYNAESIPLRDVRSDINHTTYPLSDQSFRLYPH